jgi:DNA repair exonuclease SbcCD ATPase subunit
MQSDSLFAQRKSNLEKDKAAYEEKLAAYETELKVYDDKIDELVEKKRLEMQDKRAYGEGPVAKAIQKNIDDKVAEKDKFVALKATDVEAWKASLEKSSSEISQLDEELRAEYKKNEESAHTYSGLLKRIQISHEVGGIIPLMITLIILCIEMGPIFFKMMLTKGPYDYMVENYNNLTNAENGVLKEDHIYEGKDGIIYMEKYRYLEVDKAKDAKTAKMEALSRINKRIIDSWEQIKTHQVGENPSAFIKEDQPNTKG